jgi:hypothetical protein
MSAFTNAIGFMGQLGVYDVVLPFLLVFTLIFALLEKTKVLGVEKHDGVAYTKKNLNAMMAFVAGFLVVASAELVRIINNVLANAVLLALFSVLFLMLAGSFYRDDEFDLSDKWKTFFMVLMLIGVVLIFLHATGWLYGLWFYVVNHIDGPVVGSFLLLGVVLAGMVWVTGNSKHNKGGD